MGKSARKALEVNSRVIKFAPTFGVKYSGGKILREGG